VAPRLSPLLERPIGFAHRGARALAPDNTLESFELAAKLGATGMETDIWVTADGIAVLDHDGTVGGRLRKRPIAEIDRKDLPEHIPSLDDFYQHMGTQWPLSVDVKDAGAFDAIVGSARNAGGDAEGQLWLCHPDYHQLVPWREHTGARLVDSTRLSKIKEGPERRAATLRDLGIDAVNLRHGDWSGGSITMFHRFDRLTLGWDAQHPRELANLIDSGIDGVFSDHADRLAEALHQFFPPDQSSNDASALTP
jgi:glycerophosphoryl diester phosphodiesterase